MGSTFSFINSLPLGKSDELNQKDSDIGELNTNLTILVVEDNIINQKLIDMMDETEVAVLQNCEQSADRKKSTLDPTLTKNLQGNGFMKGNWPDNSISSEEEEEEEEEEEDSRNRELHVNLDADDIDNSDYQIQFDDVVLDGNRMSENYQGTSFIELNTS